MNKRIFGIIVAVLILLILLIKITSISEKISNPFSEPEDKEENKGEFQDNLSNEAGSTGGSGTGGSGGGSVGGGAGGGGNGGDIVSENFCTGNIQFSAEINTNNEETTTDDEVILVIQNNDNSIYQNFNVYVDDLLEGTITLNGGGIANIISNEMTTWWQSLDLSQVVSRTFNIKVTNEDDCEVTNSVTLNYPYEGAPWD